jgi:hypothetical protein
VYPNMVSYARFAARNRPVRSVSATPIAEFSNTARHRSSLFRSASSTRLRSVMSMKVTTTPRVWPLRTIG